jgi:adenylate cyclase class 2
MNTEIEVKFVDINIDVMRAKLQECGAELEQPMRLMRRVIIETEDLRGKDAFVRVRDEGDKVTLTYKQFDTLSLTGAKEIETTVGSFDNAIAILNQLGLTPMSFQESKRETWKYGATEVVIDEWPHLRPYIEIEGHSEEAVKSTAADLGFDWDSAVFGDVMAAYRTQYPHLDINDSVVHTSSLKFDDPLPELLEAHGS